MRALDVQSFAGAFALGTVRAGFELAGKREQTGGFGVPAMEGNRHLLPGPWEAQSGPAEEWEPADVELVFGNPPCSGFSGLSVAISTNGQRGDWRGIEAKSNECMWDLVRHAAKCDPEIVVFESVAQAGRMGLPLMQALRDELDALTGHDYDLHHVFHNNLALGGFAERKRYFWVASRVPFGVEHPVLERTKTLRDAIGDLEDKPLGGDHVTSGSPRSQRLAYLAASGWEPSEKSHEVFARLKGELSEVWYKDEKFIGRTDAMASPYAGRRWDYDKPARVITGYGLDENVHPVCDRTFTHREVARIMGFPDEWSCQPYIDHGSKGRMWYGKQLPLSSGQWIAEWAASALKGNPGELIGEQTDDREWTIDVTKPILQTQD